MKTMKPNIDLGKYVITGTKHDLILSERGIIKEGENAGLEMAHSLAQIGVRFVPIPVETDEEFQRLAASAAQKLGIMADKAEKAEGAESE